MVAFLDKHFDFTTSLTIDECIARLEAESTRRMGFFISKKDILVRITEDGSKKNFILDRDVGRGLYAEVQGYIIKTPDSWVHISGFGRVPFLIFLLNSYFFVATFFFAYVFRGIPLLSAYILLFAVACPIFLWKSFRNRNDLIKTVYQALDADIAD